MNGHQANNATQQEVRSLANPLLRSWQPSWVFFHLPSSCCPDRNRPQLAGKTTQWLNSLRPLHLSVLWEAGSLVMKPCSSRQQISQHATLRAEGGVSWSLSSKIFSNNLCCSFSKKVTDSNTVRKHLPTHSSRYLRRERITDSSLVFYPF